MATIANKDFTWFDHLDSLKRERDYWQKEAEFQDGKNHGDTGVILYWIAQTNWVRLEQEILTVIKLLEC